MSSTRLMFPRLFRHFKFASALVAASCMLISTTMQADARARVLPPEPSNEPWADARALEHLSAAIYRYRNIAVAGGWPTLPDRLLLRPGDSSEHVITLRQRLVISGDLGQNRGRSNYYDADVEAAVIRYQRRHGLEPTGVVYGITQRSLNVTADDRVKQLELNWERARQIVQKVEKSQKYILMNSASFELQAIRNGRVELTSRTIAGKRATPTPVISATLRAINLLPYWHVPTSIARAALIPAIRKDPSYLYRERIRVFSSFGGDEIDPATVNWWGPEATRYVFRQDPGPQNALGLLRFDMPNKEIVYMHDTPMKQLFDVYERAFSAGCVRIQNFYSLADWVIGGQDDWNGHRLRGTAEAGQRTTIRLKAPVPVHFIYLTAWVEEGTVQFRNDLYNQDDGPAQAGESERQTFAQSLAP